MSSATEPAVEKDEEYYWSDNVRFLVQGKLFRVSGHQFITRSKYFSEKFHLGGGDDEGTTDIVPLDCATAAQFRVFLRIVFPTHTTSTTTSFTKDEWLTILELSVRWHFHDFRKLAIEHLDGGLTDIELIKVGRASYVPRWVLSGYQSLVEREGIITVDEADDIGNRTVNTLWIVRYLMDRKVLDGAIENELVWRFSGEISTLEAEEVRRRTVAELELEAKRAEEERRLEEERRVKAAAEQAERERLEEERARREEELEATRLLEEDSRRSRSVLITHPETGNPDQQELSPLQRPEPLEVSTSQAFPVKAKAGDAEAGERNSVTDSTSQARDDDRGDELKRPATLTKQALKAAKKERARAEAREAKMQEELRQAEEAKLEAELKAEKERKEEEERQAVEAKAAAERAKAEEETKAASLRNTADRPLIDLSSAPPPLNPPSKWGQRRLSIILPRGITSPRAFAFECSVECSGCTGAEFRFLTMEVNPPTFTYLHVCCIILLLDFHTHDRYVPSLYLTISYSSLDYPIRVTGMQFAQPPAIPIC
ncbi:hypothetical protein DFP72DRAFT_842730 [Ephemerocybe angulata]|uniref:BTB domain-containing protein n=1 Tax=Ephemerocybe angulata TaxID=980116 RepID=A0A8H6I8X9_9AGAR|nr:hypothetical protein DFP72DRAFT_842730 [Tulosesus angulatus]